ncbi:SDR family NAD(P)-dependent oxidoreductase [Streptomyces spiralis]
MDLQLADKVIVVTGATSGIGQATTHLLTAEGAHAIAVARGRTGAVPDLPDAADFLAADLTDPASAPHITDHVPWRHGRLDGLVNNVAALVSRPSFADIGDSQWHDAFALNLHAPVRLTRTLLPRLATTGEAAGAIVHVVSEAARLPDATIADYAASKAALLSLSKSLAAACGPDGIRSNVVSPGPTRTALFDAPGGFAEQLAARFDLPPEDAVDHFKGFDRASHRHPAAPDRDLRASRRCPPARRSRHQYCFDKVPLAGTGAWREPAAGLRRAVANRHSPPGSPFRLAGAERRVPDLSGSPSPHPAAGLPDHPRLGPRPDRRTLCAVVAADRHNLISQRRLSHRLPAQRPDTGTTMKDGHP